jgi:hypothetical protein
MLLEGVEEGEAPLAVETIRQRWWHSWEEATSSRLEEPALVGDGGGARGRVARWPVGEEALDVRGEANGGTHGGASARGGTAAVLDEGTRGGVMAGRGGGRPSGSSAVKIPT